MIDKCIRQHYQEGEKVGFLEGAVTTGGEKAKKLLSSAFPTKDGKLDVGQLAKNVATNKLTTTAAKKLAGTGILSSLGPIGMLIAYMLAKKGVKYAKGKMPDIKTSLQSFQEGMIGSPQEQKELRVLEKRRANMLKRKADPNKDYSERNLDIVTRAIAEAKGLDINNPNEMRNIDKPITQIQTERSITDPVITHPTFTGEGRQITTPKISPISSEDDFATTTIKDLVASTVSNPNEDRAREEKAAFDRAVAENAAKAAAEAAAQRAYAARVPDRIYGGGNGRNQGGGGGDQAAADRAGGSAYSSPFKKGGRVDKALGGRSRDIG